jgi:hypothetical protein
MFYIQLEFMMQYKPNPHSKLVEGDFKYKIPNHI